MHGGVGAQGEHVSSETDARPEIVSWVQAYAARTARQSELVRFVATYVEELR